MTNDRLAGPMTPAPMADIAEAEKKSAHTAGRWVHGDAIDGIFLLPHPTKRGEYTSEIRPATIVGFSAPDWIVARNWGHLGDALVRFECGHQSWQSIEPRSPSSEGGCHV